MKLGSSSSACKPRAAKSELAQPVAIFAMVAATSRRSSAAPERRADLAAIAEERAAAGRAELRARGSVERFRQAITDDVEILAAPVLLIEERVSHIRATLDAQPPKPSALPAAHPRSRPSTVLT